MPGDVMFPGNSSGSVLTQPIIELLLVDLGPVIVDLYNSHCCVVVGLLRLILGWVRLKEGIQLQETVGTVC